MTNDLPLNGSEVYFAAKSFAGVGLEGKRQPQAVLCRLLGWLTSGVTQRRARARPQGKAAVPQL